VYVLARSRSEIHCYDFDLNFQRLIRFQIDNGEHCRFIEAAHESVFVSCLSGVTQIEEAGHFSVNAVDTHLHT